jgi:hypothetical protein
VVTNHGDGGGIVGGWPTTGTRRCGSEEWRDLVLRNLGDGDGRARARLEALGGPRHGSAFICVGCVSAVTRAVWGCQSAINNS